MQNKYRWFSFPLNEKLFDRIGNILEANFELKDDMFVDHADRAVKISSTDIKIGIPKSDVISEQEQLEFLAAILGIDID